MFLASLLPHGLILEVLPPLCVGEERWWVRSLKCDWLWAPAGQTPKSRQHSGDGGGPRYVSLRSGNSAPLSRRGQGSSCWLSNYVEGWEEPTVPELELSVVHVLRASTRPPLTDTGGHHPTHDVKSLADLVLDGWGTSTWVQNTDFQPRYHLVISSCWGGAVTQPGSMALVERRPWEARVHRGNKWEQSFHLLVWMTPTSWWHLQGLRDWMGVSSAVKGPACQLCALASHRQPGPLWGSGVVAGGVLQGYKASIK